MSIKTTKTKTSTFNEFNQNSMLSLRKFSIADNEPNRKKKSRIVFHVVEWIVKYLPFALQ